MSAASALIIGAGPFGLSTSAHLHAREVEHVLVGRPLDTWRYHMPAGMMLRSEPYGSDISGPRQGYDVARYSLEHDLPYSSRLGPLSIERFLDYGAWWQSLFVPAVDDVTVTGVSPLGDGFAVTFEDGSATTFRTIVVAVGLLPFTVMPDELRCLPRELATHTSDHHDLTRFRGRRVAVVGGGQSTLETAALLHEGGAEVTVLTRRAAVNWLAPNPATVSRIGQVRRPVNKLCEGWHCAFWNSPSAFRRLPQGLRVRKARSVLGPAGAWWLRPRVEGVVEVRTGVRLKGAASRGSGARLLIDGEGPEALDVDHVVCGTGFRVDLGRLRFLDERLRTAIGTLDGYPVTNRSGESSVPGLFFAGATTAASLGPSVRFIAGTHNTGAATARAVARRHHGSAARQAERVA